MTLKSKNEVELQLFVRELKANRPEVLREFMTMIRQSALIGLRDDRMNAQDFEDIVQDTIWSIYQKVCQPDFHMNTPLEHYINKTLYYKKMDYRRKRVYYNAFISHMIDEVAMQYRYQTQNQNATSILNECLEDVKDSTQTLSAFELKVLYYLIDEWVPSEIAHQLNVPVKRVYNAIYRLRQKLKVIKI
ncbi:sigma-70 family RNA polymerase sigma factor [Staphylococcus hyicus]|uniref:sigma-70 family RNA polymerase sigma factor n=1 Tax=Staphylococcus hyicus TaxID=1284 RepID=UPI00208FA582|nr:sigma-70 family RNA polymerase sigma factor [Staphylococcus hyicus]MCO4329137.1 sigma-70 family RNA polymerase sigma factor [Staphylococcus hyicus]MCO4331963.1 sigma-70 family RNA polymerase sigma factor [Staphylococcus hyicus]MCO4334939.1 sigma-70 family RNA polymerase sigma factor [Staphylococcus hyicus]MCO4335328.1 sigma-70 family RNA polymerase sigma factor [Staphylococcus hyicus]UWF56565.1 sigma-70 family RNA polymerase sigma factor [Staphylococcus hyicus]